jgi:hypothetical protein
LNDPLNALNERCHCIILRRVLHLLRRQQRWLRRILSIACCH